MIEASIVAGGTLVGVVVGLAQWLALRPALPGVHWGPWTLATAAGACIGWALAVQADIAVGPLTGPVALYAAAVGTGLLVGALVGAAQALVLRPVFPGHVGWWIAGTAFAWAVTAPFAYAGEVMAAAQSTTMGFVLVAGAMFAVAGLLTGGISAVVLVLLRELQGSPRGVPRG